MRQPDLRGKTAIVTGSGRGIGRAAALKIAECGARVIVTARSEDEITAVAREILHHEGDAQSICADVSRDADIHQLFEAAGDVDILVNNAGVIWPIALLADSDPAAWRQSIDVNLTSVYNTMREALPGMLSRGWGRIVNVSSGSARGTVAGWSAYSAAKAGVEAMTSVAAREVADSGVRINSIRPGIVDTELQVEIRASSEEQFTRDNVERYRSYPERGLLRPPEHPARLILWLLSPEADAVNGELLVLDDPTVAAKVGLTPMGR
jgi:NAD(P)-dependent dehydrogenase (short-subunit alcohol dehydrogenase family)